MGWDEAKQATFSQRVKEGEEDYRYFPEPDLPPLVLEQSLIDRTRAELPELPAAKIVRFQQQHGLSAYDAEVLVAEPAVADYYENTTALAEDVTAKTVANWLSGELFGLLNQSGMAFEQNPVSPAALARLLQAVTRGEINNNTGKAVLAEMFSSDAE